VSQKKEAVSGFETASFFMQIALSQRDRFLNGSYGKGGLIVAGTIPKINGPGYHLIIHKTNHTGTYIVAADCFYEGCRDIEYNTCPGGSGE
jgi:hypothetical protein